MVGANDEINPPTTKTTNPLHHFQVSPPPGTLPSTTTLPITFFDIPWLNSCPMRRLFFYDFPHPTTHFTQSILPNLRRSLSLTLQHFFPLAGHLVTPPPPQLPFLRFSDGVDSVSLIIAESTDDYDHLTGNHPRNVTELHPFVPELNPPTVESDGSRLAPLSALQVTLFPNRGLCIGARFHHVAADGMAFHHFMKFWASLLRSGCDVSSSDVPLPSHDR
ncbi:Coumaroyl-CoA:anthocyanidin 3-O-glucoside-6''-O-coumaroyltransferase 1 [Linum perenne]